MAILNYERKKITYAKFGRTIFYFTVGSYTAILTISPAVPYLFEKNL